MAVFVVTIRVTVANHDAKRLYDDLMKKKEYNKLARPERNHTEPVVVRFGLRFAQLIDVVSSLSNIPIKFSMERN